MFFLIHFQPSLTYPSKLQETVSVHNAIFQKKNISNLGAGCFKFSCSKQLNCMCSKQRQVSVHGYFGCLSEIKLDDFQKPFGNHCIWKSHRYFFEQCRKSFYFSDQLKWYFVICLSLMYKLPWCLDCWPSLFWLLKKKQGIINECVILMSIKITMFSYFYIT